MELYPEIWWTPAQYLDEPRKMQPRIYCTPADAPTVQYFRITNAKFEAEAKLAKEKGDLEETGLLPDQVRFWAEVAASHVTSLENIKARGETIDWSSLDDEEKVDVMLRLGTWLSSAYALFSLCQCIEMGMTAEEKKDFVATLRSNSGEPASDADADAAPTDSNTPKKDPTASSS
jgi:hypothetical protein